MTATPDQIAAFLAKVRTPALGRLDAAPAGAVARSFSEGSADPRNPAPPIRPSQAAWDGFAALYADDPACAGAPIGMTVERKAETGTTVTIYWSANG
jgi:hypothetical protein